jgi:hypothetical protein
MYEYLCINKGTSYSQSNFNKFLQTGCVVPRFGKLGKNVMGMKWAFPILIQAITANFR